MSTIFDFGSMIVFAALSALFVQRSFLKDDPNDRVWHYIPPALGCAITNIVGNQGVQLENVGLQLVALLILAAVVGYILHMLRALDSLS